MENTTPWELSQAGRPYRTVTIKGQLYTQWDHEKGGCVPLNRSTPRTITHQPGAYGHSDHQQYGPAYQTPLSPSNAPTLQSNFHVPREREVGSFDYSREPSDLRSNYRVSNHRDPQDDRRPYTSRSTSVTDNRRLESEAVESDNLTGSRTSRARIPISNTSDATHRDEHESSIRENGGPYPPGTRREVTTSGRTGYLDADDQYIDEAPRLTRASETRDRTTSLNAIGNGILGTQMASNPLDLPGARRGYPEADLPIRMPVAALPTSTPQDSGRRLRRDSRPGTTGRNGSLDPRYIVRTGQDMDRFFRLGRVMAVVWHECAGSTDTVVTQNSHTIDRFGDYIYSSIRRMVIVKASQGSSWVIPILTYSGHGLMKNGLSREDIEKHTVVYMKGNTPQPLPNEVQRGLHKKPIAVDAASYDQKLDKMSRLNFGKMYTIEHNIKAMNVGTVAADSMQLLQIYFNETCSSASRKPLF